MKKAAIWTTILSALTPLIISPNLVTYATGGKTTFVRGIVFCVIALITAIIFFEKKQEARMQVLAKISRVGKHPLFVVVAINILLLAISTLFAFDTSSAFFGEPFRAEGFLTIFAFFGLFFSMAVLLEKKEWDRYFLLTTLVAAGMFLVELRQAILGMVRPDSLAGNPIYLASYFLFALAAAGFVYLRGRNANSNAYKYFGITIAVTTTIGILLTKSRGAIISLAIAVLVALFIGWYKGKHIQLGKKTLRFFAGIALLVGVVFSILFVSTMKAPFWQRVPGLNRLADISFSETTVVSRMKFTQTSVQGFFQDRDAKKLLIGWGPENYLYFFQSHYDPLIYRYEQALTDRAHNKLVEVLVMTGIVGLLSYLAVWFFLFKYSFRLLRQRFGAGLIVIFFLVAYFINNLFAFDVTMTYLSFFSVAAYLIYTSYERA
jgi:O-antigen ligase